MKKINILNMKECYLEFDHYPNNGRLAVKIHPNNLDEEDNLVLSVNIPGVECFENMFWVRGYSYELDYAKELAKENIIEQVYVESKPVYCTNDIANFYLYRITPKTFNYVTNRDSSDVEDLYLTSLNEYKNRYLTILSMRDNNFSLPLAEFNFYKYTKAVKTETNPELIAEINNIIFETNKLRAEDC